MFMPCVFFQTCEGGHRVHKWSSQPYLSSKGTTAGDFLLATNILISGNNYQKVALLFKFMKLGMSYIHSSFSIWSNNIRTQIVIFVTGPSQLNTHTFEYKGQFLERYCGTKKSQQFSSG